MYRFGFIIEQALGHITHGKNLQASVATDSSIQAEWGLPGWDVKHGLAARVNNWTVKAGLQTRQALADMHKQQPLDAIFFHTQVTAVLAQDWVRRVPSIISLDATPLQYDSLGEFYNHEPGTGPAEKVKYWLNKRCYDSAEHIVTWSSWAKQGLIDEYAINADKITVIAPGVLSAEWQRPTPRTKHDGPVKLLFVGGNLERKGGLLLFEAFRALRAEGHNVELHLATRDVVEPMDGLVVYNDMYPNTPRLKQLYYDCDIFCLPTYGDCLPMVLSEAGAAGMPVVSTKVAAIPELILDGETGFLIPTGDVAALTTTLRQLVTDADLRLQQGHRAIEVVQQEFDAARNATRLLDLLKRTANTKKSAIHKQEDQPPVPVR